MTENARERYQRMKDKYQVSRKTTDIKVPSGMVFRCVAPKTFEMTEVLRIAGIDPDKVSDEKLMGRKVTLHAPEILDEFAVNCIIEPKLLPSTIARTPACEDLSVDDLCNDDKEALIDGIMKLLKGEEGEDKAKSFPGDASGKADGRSG